MGRDLRKAERRGWDGMMDRETDHCLKNCEETGEMFFRAKGAGETSLLIARGYGDTGREA